MLKQIENGGLGRVEAIRLMARYADLFGDTTYFNPEAANAQMHGSRT
jgi:hypothetical protein